ncbi:MAG: outer membrane beta-barrel protein [Bacteroidota bacterium]|jgi:hypothetical protein
MLQKIFTTLVLITVFYSSSAAQQASVDTDTQTFFSSGSKQEEKEEPKPAVLVTGSADVYYKYDFSKQAGNNRTSFTGAQNAFSLGMASVKFEHTTSKVSVVADLGFGNRAEEFAYNDAGTLAAIKQAYVSYTPVEGLKFTAGSWATHVGYELVDPQLNRNYSMSYMFTNGPFTHTGIKAEYAKGKSGFMIGLSNATDFRVPPTDQINRKFVIAQYSLAASDNVKLYANYVGGKAPDTSVINQFDIVATATVSKKTSLGLNATLNNSKAWDGVEKKSADAQNWWGLAGYFNYDPKANFGLTLRSEYFNDEKAVKGIGTTIFANTLSFNYKVDGFILIPELRYESAALPIYTNSSGVAASSAVSFTLAAIYKF